MTKRLMVLAVALLAACTDNTSPVVDGTSKSAILAGPSPDGTWRFTGTASHYKMVQFKLVRALNSDEFILDGDATADLNCAAGATTYQLTPSIATPCHLTGTFFGKQTSVTTITGFVSWREAPMALLFNGPATLDATANNFTVSIESRANNETPIIVSGVAFAKQP